MFRRIKKFVLAFCVGLLSVSFLVPARLKAQEYVPTIGQVNLQQAQSAEETQACVTIQPLDPAPVEVFQIRENMMWIPSILNGGPQCVPILNALVGAVRLISPQDIVVPVRSADKTTFEAIGQAIVTELQNELNPTIDPTIFEEASRGESNGYYNKLIGLWYLGQEEAAAAGTNLIPPPFEDPGSYYVVRLTITSDLFTNVIFLKLEPSTVLYTCASKACDPTPLTALCPEGTDLSDFQAIYLGSYPVPKVVGLVSKLEMWTQIGHTPRTLGLCPGASGYTYLDGPSTWAGLGVEAREDVETVVEGQREWLQRNIRLLPVGGGQPISAPAMFRALDNGQIAWIGIAIEIGGIILKFIAAARGAPAMP